MTALSVTGGEIRPGDIMRFRLSKHEPARWLKVLATAETKSGKRVCVALEGGCLDLVSKIETRQVRRGEVLAAAVENSQHFLKEK